MDQAAQSTSNQKSVSSQQPQRSQADPVVQQQPQQHPSQTQQPTAQTQATPTPQQQPPTQPVTNQMPAQQAQQPQQPQVTQSTQVPPQQAQAVIQQAAQPQKLDEPVSVDKERAEAAPQTEVAPIVELKEHYEFEPEVEGWLEHLKQDGEIDLPEPIKDGDKIVMADAGAQVVDEKIVLPMTQAGVQQGVGQKVTESARWLAEWCNRLIKMFGDKTAYRAPS